MPNSHEMKRVHSESDHPTGSVKKKRKLSPSFAQWYKGKLCPIEEDNPVYHIRPLMELPEGYEKSKNVLMYPDSISEFVLSVAQNDTLEFLLGERDKTKPMARKVRVSQYSSRTCRELIDYIRKLILDLEDVYFKNVLTQVLPCTAMWRFLGSPVFRNKEGS